MTLLKRLLDKEKKTHAILVEKLAFLIHYYGMIDCKMPKKAIKYWNEATIKNTPYGERLFNIAEKFSKIKLKE